MPCPSRAIVFASAMSAVQALHDWDSGDHWFEPHGHSLSLWFVVGLIVVIVLFAMFFLLCAPHGRHHPYNRHQYTDDIVVTEGGKHKHKHKHSTYHHHHHHHATPYATNFYSGAPMAGPVSFVPRYYAKREQ